MSASLYKIDQTYLGLKADCRLSAGDIELLIAELAKSREKMTPAVGEQMTFPDGAKLRGIAEPTIIVRHHRGSRAKTLAIRHPGVGWLQFLLSEEGARKLADDLT